VIVEQSCVACSLKMKRHGGDLSQMDRSDFFGCCIMHGFK